MNPKIKETLEVTQGIGTDIGIWLLEHPAPHCIATFLYFPIYTALAENYTWPYKYLAALVAGIYYIACLLRYQRNKEILETHKWNSSRGSSSSSQYSSPSSSPSQPFFSSAKPTLTGQVRAGNRHPTTGNYHEYLLTANWILWDDIEGKFDIVSDRNDEICHLCGIPSDGFLVIIDNENVVVNLEYQCSTCATNWFKSYISPEL